MLCELCHKKEACLHATKIENRVVKHLHLCEDCARKAGFDFATGAVDLQKLTKRWGENGLELPMDEGRRDAPVTGVCPQCGMESSEVAQTHQAGCPRCYETFPDELLGELREAQRGLRLPRMLDFRESQRDGIEASDATPSLLRGLPGEGYDDDPGFAGAELKARAERRGARTPSVRKAGGADGAAKAGRADRAGGVPTAAAKRRALQAAMERAIREERYEDAAELRDELRRLEKGEG